VALAIYFLGRVPEFINIRARNVKNYGPLLKYEYQFKSKFRYSYSPFRYNRIDNIQLLESPDSITTFKDLLVHQEDWKWDDDIINIIKKR